jgi:hypothetical protein
MQGGDLPATRKPRSHRGPTAWEAGSGQGLPVARCRAGVAGCEGGGVGPRSADSEGGGVGPGPAGCIAWDSGVRGHGEEECVVVGIMSRRWAGVHFLLNPVASCLYSGSRL